MVLLTMTKAIVDGLNELSKEQPEPEKPPTGTITDQVQPVEPPLFDPNIGKPISHNQILELWKKLSASESSTSSSLEGLLQGSRIYVPPPPPKPEPSAEYKALMARLRREEEARSYERMINPPLVPETFQSRFPNAASSFAEVNRPSNVADMGDDEVTVNEIHRQVMLIFNFLISIVGVAATLWIAGRWWSLPSRIFLTMGGSIVVGIAEVAVYSGYMWRMGEAKSKQAAAKEVRQVMKTWIVGQDADDNGDEKTVLLKSKLDETDGNVRKRAAITTDVVN